MARRTGPEFLSSFRREDCAPLACHGCRKFRNKLYGEKAGLLGGGITPGEPYFRDHGIVELQTASFDPVEICGNDGPAFSDVVHVERVGNPL
jgi:hypothetical protein